MKTPLEEPSLNPNRGFRVYRVYVTGLFGFGVLGFRVLGLRVLGFRVLGA